ncbi:MAG: GntR family transcriptional regulator [Chloroflexota bacterium]
MFDSDSPVPLYYQLRKFITERIEAGEWKPGDRLPSESELGSQFGISRTTVRQALGELTSLGLLKRIQGKGTFVGQPRIQQRLLRLTGFSQDMNSRRMRSASRLLDLELVRAEPPVAERLALPPEAQVVFLRRLRLADAEPMALEASYLLSEFYEILRRENLAERSLYDVLGSCCGTAPTRAVQEMEATACPAFAAQLLGVRKGSPVLHIHRTTFDQNGRSFEQVESFYRGDRYIFYAELAN